MGQDVAIKDTFEIGDVLIIDTDRSFTGQDGHTMTPNSGGEGVPGILASRLFGLNIGIDHVFVLQNTITVRRPGGWDEDYAESVSDVTQTFLRFYDDENTVT